MFLYKNSATSPISGVDETAASDNNTDKENSLFNAIDAANTASALSTAGIIDASDAADAVSTSNTAGIASTAGAAICDTGAADITDTTCIANMRKMSKASTDNV